MDDIPDENSVRSDPVQPKASSELPTPALLTRDRDGQRFELTWEKQHLRLVPSKDGAARDAAAEGELALSAEAHFAVRGVGWNRRLEIGADAYRVDRGHLESALLLIALCRLGALPGAPFETTPFIHDPGPIARAALRQQQAPETILLGCLPTKRECDARSPVLGRYRASFWFVVSDRDALLVAVSQAGDVHRRAVSAESVSIGDDGVTVDGEELASRAKHELRELARLAKLPTTERLLAAARLHHQAVSAAAQRKANHLLEAAAVRGRPEARVLNSWLNGDADAFDEQASGVNLVALRNDFQLSDEQTSDLLARLPRTEAWTRGALALSRALHDARVTRDDEPAVKLEAGLDHSELLLAYGRSAEATEKLSRLRALLPEPTLADVELPTGLPKSSWSRLRRRLEHLTLQLGECANASAIALATSTARQVPQLTPLDFDVIEQSARFVPEATATKLRHAHALLTEPGALTRDQQTKLPLLRGLSAEQLEQVRHPMAKAHEQFLARVQSAAAKTQRPDFSTLKLYCERITDKASSVAHVVDEAATMLGVGHVDVYVSRGHDDVGLRAFSDHTPVLLVGGQHLEADSRYHMTPLELLFAVAGELAHLRFEHARVGPKDVARGLFDKGKQGFDIVLSLLPVVAGLKLADRLTMVTARLSLPRVGKLMTAAKDLSKALESGEPQQPRSDLAQANESLIAAHRFSQLTADRAGLLACGDPSVAFYSLLLSRTDYVRVSTRLEQQDLLTAISEQRSTNPRAFDDLLMRLGFLVGYYVSDEFDALRAALAQRPGDAQ